LPYENEHLTPIYKNKLENHMIDNDHIL